MRILGRAGLRSPVFAVRSLFAVPDPLTSSRSSLSEVQPCPGGEVGDHSRHQHFARLALAHDAGGPSDGRTVEIRVADIDLADMEAGLQSHPQRLDRCAELTGANARPGPSKVANKLLSAM